MQKHKAKEPLQDNVYYEEIKNNGGPPNVIGNGEKSAIVKDGRNKLEEIHNHVK